MCFPIEATRPTEQANSTGMLMSKLIHDFICYQFAHFFPETSKYCARRGSIGKSTGLLRNNITKYIAAQPYHAQMFNLKR